MLSVKNLTKTYQTGKSGQNTVVALNNVSIDFPETGFVFLLGKSGSGKSTLLNVIGGLDVYDKGEIVIKGKSSKTFTQSDFDSYRNTFIGFIFQEYNILENFTVAKNLALAIELQGKKANKEEVNKLLNQVEMLPYATRKPNQLSGGQKQRVAIARALIKNPEIIMADEPTGALDSNTGKQVMDTLKELSKTKLVIVVSHDRDFAEIYGDRIIELKDGVIISDVTKKEVESKQTESGVKIIDDSILYIKKGQKITDAQLKQISDFVVQKSQQSDTFISFSEDANEKLKESANINEEGNREKFVETEKDDINLKQYNPNSLKLIKSRLKFTDSFKIGTSSLKHKVGRLIFTILLSFFAFTVFGVVDALSCWNRSASVYQALELTHQKYVALSKRIKTDNGYRGGSVKQKDIEKLKEKFPNYTFKGVADGPSYYNINNDDMGVQLSYTYSNPYYETSMTGFVNITEEEIQKYGFDLIGRLPDKPNEICLSKHIFDIICELSKNSDNPVTDIDNLKINFDNRTEYHTVVGIVDDKKDLSNLKDLDEETDYMKIMMIRSQIDYGFSRMAYVCEEEYNRILNEGVDTHISLEFKNSGYGIDKDYLYTFEKALETYYDEKSHYESCQIEFINSTYNHKLYLEGNGKEYYYWEIWDEHNNLLYKYNYYNQKFEDGNGYPLEEEAINTIFSRYGLDNNGDGIPDEFKDNVNKLFYEDYVTYIKNDGTLLVNGKIKDIGENEILLPQEWLTSTIGPELKEEIDDGLTIELSARETGDEPIIFTVVGAVNSRYTTRIYVSKSTYNNNIMPLFEGYSYIISNLTGNDEAFIKYCETYNDEGVKFIVQNSATSILDMLEDVIVYTAKIFLYIAIGFALFASFLLMNFISTSIAHKKREIGVLRALGARGSDIFGIFLNESTVISLINFALSAIATFIICYFINVALLAKLGIDIVLLTPGIRQFILILAISWGSAFISSLIPSMKISKKKPIDAINNR